ncbi:MAG: DUF1887 family CARF protein, partial [Candidatus Heimdallarchaeota archaeon]|nr:DUF1887 family CARF protein [Candidatus Heimdallarchaeota archaeon]
LLGSNPIVPVTSIKYYVRSTTKIYILLSKDMQFILNRIKSWKQKYFNNLKGLVWEEIIVDPYNPTIIRERLTNQIKTKDLEGNIVLDVTGGTKQMTLAVFMYLQNFNINGNKIWLSYIVNQPWKMIVSDIDSLQTYHYPVAEKFSLKEVIHLHQDKVNFGKLPKATLLINLSHVICQNIVQDRGNKTWNNWKNKNIHDCFNGRNTKGERELEKIHLDFSKFPDIVQQLSDDKKRATFEINDLKGILSFNSNKKVVDWFNGFWLETYTFSLFKNTKLGSLVDDIKVNVHVFDPEFELDVVILVKNRIYVISISTGFGKGNLGKADLKKKIFEVIIRSRQIGGWKAYYGLISLTDRPEELEKEVEDYLVDRSVKVFGRRDLIDLEEKIINWIELSI